MPRLQFFTHSHLLFLSRRNNWNPEELGARHHHDQKERETRYLKAWNKKENKRRKNANQKYGTRKEYSNCRRRQKRRRKTSSSPTWLLTAGWLPLLLSSITTSLSRRRIVSSENILKNSMTYERGTSNSQQTHPDHFRLASGRLWIHTSVPVSISSTLLRLLYFDFLFNTTQINWEFFH